MKHEKYAYRNPWKRYALFEFLFFFQFPIEESIDFEAISAQLEGYSPADITVVCRHAALAGVSR